MPPETVQSFSFIYTGFLQHLLYLESKRSGRDCFLPKTLPISS
jgi:hypothetical protein